MKLINKFAPLLLILALFFVHQDAEAERHIRLPASKRFSFLPKRSLNTNILGINAFANDQRFGKIKDQFLEVKNTIKIKKVRILFAWNDQVQPTPNSAPDFSFYDEIARSLPRDTEALVVMTGVPSWMNDSRNWVDNNPRKTFVELWVKKVVNRYRKNSKLKAWQIWNEPNMVENPDNVLLEMAGSSENYVEMLAAAYQYSKSVARKKKVVSAATTAINQNFPETLDYNNSLLDAGIENFLDFWGVHYYGSGIENIIRPNGIQEFIRKLKKPIWMTESGEQGTNKQLSYAKTIWPLLIKSFPAIQRLYIYQFTEDSPADSTYGLKNLTKGRTVSDLYIALRDRKKDEI